MSVIAIIDDDVQIGNVLEKILQGEGSDTLRAYSGTEALYLLSNTKPDLVLLDLIKRLSSSSTCEKSAGES